MLHEQETRDPNLGQKFRECLKLSLRCSNNKDVIVCLPGGENHFQSEEINPYV